ncbi:hypothetical protein [uncultured Algimonas sp.]|uniref:hypothetical protein n=1 Tax=uncultured Algimonas sp. TaxID=1547920 RepID=UPI002639A464|nr:hypothetical protein [uncultured Algimonas sp.]
MNFLQKLFGKRKSVDESEENSRVVKEKPVADRLSTSTLESEAKPALPVGYELDEAIEQARASLSNVHPVDPSRNRIAFVTRGSSGVRWFPDPQTNTLVQRDEYAENIPEALVEICQKTGWELVVIYMGRAPEFDAKHLSYSDRFPETARDVDFSGLGSSIANLRLAMGNHFQKKWDEVRDDSGFKAAFSYKGIPLYEEVELGLDRFAPVIAANDITNYAHWKALFDHFSPLMIIGGRLDSNPGLLQAAQDADVFSANVKLGIGEEMLTPFFLGDGDGRPAKRISPDLHLLWGPKQAEMLDVRVEEHPSDWVAVGRTRNDSFGDAAPAGRSARFREHIGAQPNSPIIVYGANHRTFYAKNPGDNDGLCCLSWNSYKAAMVALIDVAREHPGTVVVVKPHPSDDISNIRKFVETITGPVRIVTNEEGFHNAAILGEADIFVSSVSSMFSEALASDCVPVSLWLDEINFLYEKNRHTMFSEIALPAESIKEMKSVVAEILSTSNKEPILAELRGNLPHYFGPVDGRNADRAVTAALHALMDRRPELADAAEWLKDTAELSY